ncbi:FMN-dependent NADH-azoreductase [Komagataeibacter xylinus E25]|nr:FMN-dependent NADH-azoreductase [Komagataeibacter xylinus E25]
MNKILFVEASPRGAASKSTQLANEYLETLSRAGAGVEVDHLKIWEADLPTFDGDKVAAKMAVIGGQEQSASEKTAWEQISEIAGRFASADRYVFSVPMWNGGIPYRLKHYIDIVHQPGILWGLTPDAGYFGLLKNKHATLVLTAGAYSPDFPAPAFGVDHQSTYLHDWLTQAGVEQIDEVRFQPTLLTATPEADFEKAKRAAIGLAEQHSSTF